MIVIVLMSVWSFLDMHIACLSLIRNPILFLRSNSLSVDIEDIYYRGNIRGRYRISEGGGGLGNC